MDTKQSDVQNEKSETLIDSQTICFWYPAVLTLDDVPFPELAEYVATQRKRIIVPVSSIGHMMLDEKLLCEIDKNVEIKRLSCDCSLTYHAALANVSVCSSCIAAYKNMPITESMKLKRWIESVCSARSANEHC